MNESADTPDNPETPAGPEAEEPDVGAVRKYLLYSLSLPERAVRSSVGLIGGAARETTSLLIPQAFQDSKTYQILISQTLDFVVEDVGGVKRDKPEGEEDSKVENYVARKAVGNFAEIAGLLTFHLSPITLLAIVSDVAYGSTAYIRELGEELKKQGVIAEDSTILQVNDLLEAVAQASGEAASTVNTPPLSVEGLRDAIAQTRESLGKIDPAKVLPQAEIERLWKEMHDIAAQQDVGLLTVSATMTMHALGKVANVGRGALSTVKVAGTLFDRHILTHYTDALHDVQDKGVYRVLAETSEPYVEAVWRNFAGDTETVTEDVLSGRFFARMGRWLSRCCRGKPAAADPPKKDAAENPPPAAESKDVETEDTEKKGN